ncbi:MAG: ACP S-malonyltransferase [Lachnospiraceae bacterium]|nr:ACP S-malonyltransferase [Lachnospiraceae bacterium]
MSKTVFMFPGQGSQYVGMAKDFYDAYPEVREVFSKASEAAGFSVEELCFEENEKLNITEYTQICMLAAEAAVYTAAKKEGLKCDVTAGLSLGEYGALIASGAMSMEDAFKVVRQRGKFMQAAVPEGGAMAAILNLDPQIVADVCKEVEAAGPDADAAAYTLPYVVSVANYNSPVQIVITGREDAVKKASDICVERGARRAVPLKVSGPFHSALLKGAGEQLGKVLEDVTVNDPVVPYLANVTADYVTGKDQVKPLLTAQVSSSVKWQQTLERLLADGADLFVELGPGSTLTGFVKKLNKEVKTVNIEKLEDLKAYLEG